MIAVGIIVAILIIVIIYVISVSNSLNKSLVKIDEASSGIDVALTKRYDVLTKMIDAVKGYSKHEQETLFKTVELRKNMTIQEKNTVNEAMNENLSKIYALAESYPELKSSENYKVLQQSIVDVEEHLQASRRLYNANVSSFNQKIVTFPVSIIATSKCLAKKDFFIADEKKREDVKINL